MDIKDLAGLSEPLKRLIEVISAGVGGVFRPYLVRKNADAKAHEIKVVAAALDHVAKNHGIPLTYQDGEILVPEGRSLELPTVRPVAGLLSMESVSQEQRAIQRAEHVNRKRQQSIENITGYAAAELIGATAVAEEQPDEDWIRRFFSSAEDVSSEQMQMLWGRVLAGEISRPGMYSLRTLDFLRNITTADARLLEQAATFSLRLGGGQFILPGALLVDALPSAEFNLSSLIPLGELGVVSQIEIEWWLFGSQDSASKRLTHVIEDGDFKLELTRKSPAKPVRLTGWNFTRIGCDLLQLVDRKPKREHMQLLGTTLAALYPGVSWRLLESSEEA